MCVELVVVRYPQITRFLQPTLIAVLAVGGSEG